MRLFEVSGRGFAAVVYSEWGYKPEIETRTKHSVHSV